MLKKVLMALGQGSADILQGVVQDLVLGKKARRGRNGAFKPKRVQRTYTHRATYRPRRTVVVHVYAGGRAFF